MEYTMRPVVDIRKLETALSKRYPITEFDECRRIMWDEDFYNDSYKSFYFRENGVPVTAETYEFYKEEEIERAHQYDLICAFLCEVFPDFDSILVDVSW